MHTRGLNGALCVAALGVMILTPTAGSSAFQAHLSLIQQSRFRSLFERRTAEEHIALVPRCGDLAEAFCVIGDEMIWRRARSRVDLAPVKAASRASEVSS